MRFLAIGPPLGERMPRKSQNLKTFLKDHLTPSRCGDQWRARAILDLLSLAQNSTFRRARSAVHDAPQAHPSARFPPRPARDARPPALHDSPAATPALFFNSLMTVVGLTWSTRAVSRMPLAFIAMSMICCFTPAACPAYV